MSYFFMKIDSAIAENSFLCVEILSVYPVYPIGLLLYPLKMEGIERLVSWNGFMVKM